MKFLASLQHMPESEVRKLVPSDTMVRIKSKDSTPLIQVYCVAEEGEAEGNLVKYGKVLVSYVRETIASIQFQMQHGTKAFHLHNADSGHADRTDVGELVGKGIDYVEGKMRAIAAIYIKPEYRNLGLDVASIETTLELDQSSVGSFTATKVLEVTGIALGNSKYNTPGFPSATLQAQFQAFADSSNSTNSPTKEQSKMAISLKELKDAIRDGSYNPSDLFGKSDLVNDSIILNLLKEKTDALDSTSKQLEAEKSARANDAKDSTERINSLTVEIVKTKAPSVATGVMEARKIVGKKAEFIKSKLALFTPKETSDDKLKTEVETHITQLNEEFNAMSKLFGTKDDSGTDDAQGKSEENKSGNSGTSSDDSTSSGKSDLTDKKNNPFIPD